MVSTNFDSKSFLLTLTARPGVYQMMNTDGEVIYVGKARNLKKRVSSYFQHKNHPRKTQLLVSNIADIAIIVTASEKEALILESNLIKRHKPRYNVLFRDDKSFPFIYLSDHQDFPLVEFVRDKKQKKGQYFGPYPNVSSARKSLYILQKLFKVRQCKDSFFKNRSRPCLQYQIKRCSAPCVGYVDKDKYQEAVEYTKAFLSGKSQELIEQFTTQMEQASKDLNFERAGELRDQINSLRRTQENQHITKKSGDIDVAVLVSEMNTTCFEMLTVRGGAVIGSKSYYPKLPSESEMTEALSDLLAQYYFDEKRTIPKTIITNIEVADRKLLSEALTDSANHKVVLTSHVKGQKAHWLRMTIDNANEHLLRKKSSQAMVLERFTALQASLNLPQLPLKIECFDVSHTTGTSTSASCVVFDTGGAKKSQYRRFNIKDEIASDDYGAMEQAVKRRYQRIKKEGGEIPDIVLIDGGKGQLSRAANALKTLEMTGVILIAIAKGATRKPGMETLWIYGQEKPLVLNSDSPALHLLQEIRDEAHRFAISGHKIKRAKKAQTSLLETIPGVGKTRRRSLLNRFGGLRDMQSASVEELAKVKGISKSLAVVIHKALQEY